MREPSPAKPQPRYYGAKVLAADIEDNPENYTRFFLVRRAAEAEIDPEANKISVAFSLEHRPGSLAAALERARGRWAPISPKSNRARCTASPGNTSSMWIA